MKILFISHYNEGSGWSNCGIDLIKAINKSGIDIVCRSVKLGAAKPLDNDEINRLESKSLSNVDVCIQHVLPHHFVKTNKFKKNIGYFVAESTKINAGPWFNHLDLLDEIWVPNHTLKQSLVSSGFDKTVKVIPHAFDLTKYGKNYGRVDFGHNKFKFKFYFIADLSDRKNIVSIIRSFHSEFHPSEPVALVIKTKKHGANPQDVQKYMGNLCRSIKEQMRLYQDINQYHKEIIIADSVDDNQINMLHSSCDCFVGPTHGEGWCIPAFDAMCFGKTPICSNEGGPKEFIDIHDTNTGWLVNGTYGICNHGDPAFPELFTGADEWFVPSESVMKKAMRFYYENRKSIDKSAGLKRASIFSYENVGGMIKDELTNDK
jgi:glycosyltransferase involved in cell wall biosynthesis